MFIDLYKGTQAHHPANVNTSADLTVGGIIQEARRYMEEGLTEERTYNATQLAEVLKEKFSVVVTPEAVRQHLHSMGYSWKRTRYVPNKEPDPVEEREAQCHRARGALIGAQVR